jgi:SAM-dependent methyltransferase
MKPNLTNLDQHLAERFGGYASYHHDDASIIENYGDAPADEVDRLLDTFCKPPSRVLDLGCGAGFTLCRLAPKVAEIWGFDQEPDLVEATRQRAAQLGLGNTHCVLGNVAVADEVNAELPDAAFDVVFSRRGPNVNAAVLRKMKPDAIVIQELVQGTLGVKPLFGREPFLPEVGHNPHRLIAQYAELDLVPMSVKDYFFDEFFRDADQLIGSLKAFLLWDWTMPNYPYNEARDRAALEVYVQYNTTPRGIRVTHRRSVYVFRRTEVRRFPAVPEAKRLYSPYV